MYYLLFISNSEHIFKFVVNKSILIVLNIYLERLKVSTLYPDLFSVFSLKFLNNLKNYHTKLKDLLSINSSVT